jgi:hypothetical protein
MASKCEQTNKKGGMGKIQYLVTGMKKKKRTMKELRLFVH